MSLWSRVINNPMPWVPYPKKGFRVLVVDDWKSVKHGTPHENYWRNSYLQSLPEDYPVYKGNRVGRKYPEGYWDLHKTCFDICEIFGVNVYREEGYEADDWFGLIAELSEQKKFLRDRDFYFVTVDSDILQLVSDRVTWVNAADNSKKHSRIRREKEGLAWVKDRLGTQLTKLSELAILKSREGDTSDNLNPGSPVEVIDLTHPDKPRPSDLRLIPDLVSTKSNTSQKAHFEAWDYLTKNGL